MITNWNCDLVMISNLSCGLLMITSCIDELVQVITVQDNVSLRITVSLTQDNVSLSITVSLITLTVRYHCITGSLITFYISLLSLSLVGTGHIDCSLCCFKAVGVNRGVQNCMPFL